MKALEMILFVVTDIHGHFRELVNALEKAGYDRNDPKHLLVVLGDCFDRGRQNREVLEFLEGIERKIIVRGNHEDLLEDVLDSHKIELIHELNGTEDTILDFFGKGSIDPHTCRLIPDRFVEDRLKAFLAPMVNYFETEKHIFVHGWIACNATGYGGHASRYYYNPDWRTADYIDWDFARWYNGMEAARQGVIEPNKTIVCGHWNASYGHAVLEGKGKEHGEKADYTPYYGKGIIALDACTALSQMVNCIVIED